MALAPGTRLGAYEIVGLVGAGGMGEVYRARDTKLSRDVFEESDGTQALVLELVEGPGLPGRSRHGTAPFSMGRRRKVWLLGIE
jgi:serine/threonine protein kinase